MDLKINFSGRAIRYTEEEIAVVVEAMRHADPLTQGEYMRAFESKFAAYQGVAQGSCFTTMNGCAALEMSAQLCCFTPGDEVVMPSHTFTASAYPYVKKGARLVWADVDLHTRVVTVADIEKALTPRTKAVVVVHLYGYVADMPEIAALCRERGLILIEDAAQAIGTEVGGKRPAVLATWLCFPSIHTKNLTTLGEGGMLYVRDPKLAALVPALRHNGHCAYDFARAQTTGSRPWAMWTCPCWTAACSSPTTTAWAKWNAPWGPNCWNASTRSTTKSAPGPCALSTAWRTFLSWNSTAWTPGGTTTTCWPPA